MTNEMKNNNQKLKYFLIKMSKRLIEAGIEEWNFDSFYITGEYRDLGKKITSDLICLEFDTSLSSFFKDDDYFYFYDDNNNMFVPLDYLAIADEKQLDELMRYIENRVKDLEYK